MTRPTRCSLLPTLLLASVAMPARAQPIPTSPDATPAAEAPVAETPVADPVARAWGFADTDVPVDSAVRFGLLPNGMKYAVRANATPRDTVIVRMAIDHGSLSETEEERGLSHFLEHMAFNGSAAVPEGEMVKLLEREGLAFGADTNAGTGFDGITYKLDLPRNTDALIDTALMLMRETASNLTLAPDAVERERGVIESERRARDSFSLRNTVDNFAFIGPDTRLATRLPIGEARVIATATADQMRALYRATYRPADTTLVVVGDVDVDAVEARIRARFADWSAEVAGRPEPTAGTVDLTRPRAFDNWVHPDVAETVTINWFAPWRPTPQNRAQTLASGLRSLAFAVVNRRLSTRTLAPDSPFVGAGAGSGELFRAARTVSASATVKDGDWARALTLLENEVRRAAEFGVTQAEVEEQLASVRTRLENAAKSADTQRSAALAGPILAAAEGDGEVVVTAPADDLALFTQIESELTAEAVSAALTALFAERSAPLVRVTGKTPVAGGEAAIAAAYDAATRVALSAPDQAATAAFAYTDFGPAGAVVADDTVADLGIRRVRFANNVMLNLRRTEFERDRVRVGYRVDGGGLLETRGAPLPGLSLTNLMGLGGLEAHSADELRTILAGRDVDTGLGLGSQSFGSTSNTTPRDLALQLRVMAATITHPGYRPEALAILRRALPTAYAQYDATPEAVIGRDVGGILSDGDPRFTTPPLERVLALEWDDFHRAAGDSLANGAIEVTIVGEVDERAAIDAVAATFGALPTRRADFAARTEARQRSFTAAREPHVLLHQGQADQAALRMYWPTTDDADLATDVGLRLLSGVFGLRLLDELRERTGATYSPVKGSVTSEVFPGYGYLYAGANLKPDTLATARASVLAVVDELVGASVDDDLLLRARAPIVEGLRKAPRENGYWMSVAGDASSRPERLDRARQALRVVEAVTPADLRALAQRYLTAPPVVIEARPDPDKPADG